MILGRTMSGSKATPREERRDAPCGRAASHPPQPGPSCQHVHSPSGRGQLCSVCRVALVPHQRRPRTAQCHPHGCGEGGCQSPPGNPHPLSYSSSGHYRDLLHMSNTSRNCTTYSKHLLHRTNRYSGPTAPQGYTHTCPSPLNRLELIKGVN